MRMMRGGFTLFEVMIVVVMLGILAALFIPRFAVAHSDTKVVATGEDLLGIVRAVEIFNTNNGYWPVDTPAGKMPYEIKSQYKGENPFETPSPIGGIFDYDNIMTTNTKAIRVSIRSSFTEDPPSTVDAQALDAYLDDGVLNTGKFQSSVEGYSYTAFTH
jgi:prepilin-type N-terminal cleavage/methylation domain-containing protein